MSSTNATKMQGTIFSTRHNSADSVRTSTRFVEWGGGCSNNCYVHVVILREVSLPGNYIIKSSTKCAKHAMPGLHNNWFSETITSFLMNEAGENPKTYANESYH